MAARRWQRPWEVEPRCVPVSFFTVTTTYSKYWKLDWRSASGAAECGSGFFHPSRKTGLLWTFQADETAYIIEPFIFRISEGSRLRLSAEGRRVDAHPLTAPRTSKRRRRWHQARWAVPLALRRGGRGAAPLSRLRRPRRHTPAPRPRPGYVNEKPPGRGGLGGLACRLRLRDGGPGRVCGLAGAACGPLSQSLSPSNQK